MSFRVLRKVIQTIVTLFFLFFAFTPSAAAQSPNCSAANPNDWNGDSSAIQACIDNNDAVYLEPGNPGYVIDARIFIKSRTTVLSSVGGKAKLIAASGLARHMIGNDGGNYYTISELIVDGNRDNRTESGKCTSPDPGLYAGAHGSNMILTGTGWTAHHIDTINAMCGSGLEVTGNSFEIYSVYAANNGFEGSKWADGITLVRCDGGYVHNNDLVDNTDIGLVIFKGNSCAVRFNTVTNRNRFAFAGLKVGDPGSDSSVSLSGSAIKDNTIYASYNKLGFGLLVGHHPWDPNKTISDAGEVSYNTIEGAMANLVIDGIGAGYVMNNSMSNAQGSASLTCSYTANYTAADFGSATIQSGYVSRDFHPGC